MSTPLAYGIDFGTTNSAIAIAYHDEAVLVQHGRSAADVVPSVIYLDRTRQRLIGEDAVRQYLVNPDPETARLLWSVKYFLADEIWFGTTAPSGAFMEPEDLVAIVLAELKSRADQECGHDVRRVVLGHPVIFAGADGVDARRLNDLAKRRLEQGAYRAGFEEVALLEESQAALVGEDRTPGVIASLDFGGGTFDVSIIRTDSDGHRRLLASQGVAVGGDVLSESLFDSLLATQLGYYEPLPRDFHGATALPEFRSVAGEVSIVGNTQTRRLLQHFLDHPRQFPELSVLGEVVLGGHSYSLHREVDDLKVALSNVHKKSLAFRRPGISLHGTASRPAFEQLITEPLALVDDAIERALAQAEVDPEEIHLVVRTGGSSQIPMFVERINARFGRAKVEQRDAFATVALGLALEALEVEW
jgi:hypothetical chaperone protein